MTGNNLHPKTWRDYQKELKRRSRIRSCWRGAPRLGLYGVATFLAVVVVFFSGSWLLANLGDAAIPRTEPPKQPEPQTWSKKDLPELLKDIPLDLHEENGSLTISKGGKPYTVEVSIDHALQAFISRLLRRSLTHEAAAIVLRPENGQILAMTDFRNGDTEKEDNLCLKAGFPAASLFKIVSAAAAIEACDFTPQKPLTYSGRRYTLYKSQLKEKRGRWDTQVTFEKAFSKSINPVFGKMGIYDLGQDLLTQYAGRFLFNAAIPFDLPLEASNTQIPEDDFGLAEIASGFNKTTLISPLHAALMTSAVVNKGTVMKPWVVKCVRDETDHRVYQVTPSSLTRVIEQSTAENLEALMAQTVASGTCSRSFRPLLAKKAFKTIKLGAKTGTINDRDGRYKIDWLAAYALPKDGRGGICVTILAVHGEKLGIRANDLGREIIKHYFSS